MNLIIDSLTSPLSERIGMTILHSFWQLTLVAILAYLLLEILRRSSPNVRYLVSYSSLAIMVLLPITTFMLLETREENPARVIKIGNKQLSKEQTSPPSAQTPSLDSKPNTASSSVVIIPPQTRAPHLKAPAPTPQSPIVSTTLAKTSPSLLEAPIEVAASQSLLQRINHWIAPWLPRIAALWLAGFLIVTLRNLGGWQTTRRLRTTSTEPTDQRVGAIISALSSRLGIKSEVCFRESSFVLTPIIFGWLKPVILTPIGLLAQLSNSQLEALLAHELAHVRRHDYFFNILQTAAESLLFFHPAVWWVSRRIRLEREFCCDDLAVSLCGDHLTYAQALTSIEESREFIGAGLAAGEKPLMSRIKRVLGYGPRKNSSFSLLGISGGGLLATFFCGLVLIGNSQEVGDDSKNEPPKKRDPYEQTTAYDQLSKLENKLKKLLKAGQTDQAVQTLITELPPISDAWLSPEVSSLVTSSTSRIQERIVKERTLLPLLIQKIQTLDAPKANKAAMLDIVGAAEEARELYADILTSEPQASTTIRLHQIRLLGQVAPSQLPTLLEGAPDSQQTEDAVCRAFHEAETFALSIQALNGISTHLEQVELPSKSNYRWVPRMSRLFQSRVYGDHQMPPLWEPRLGHSNSIIGTPSNPHLHEIRRQACKRLCEATLRLPSQAAWGFSRLAALADLQQKFDNNQELLDYANKALQSSQEVTPLGIFGEKLEGPRFYSPELYLARSRWKGTPSSAKFTPAIEARITLLAELLSANPDDFKEKSQAMVNDQNLKEKVYQIYTARQENQATIAVRRTREIMQISRERSQPGENLEMVLNLVTSPEGITTHSLAHFGEVFLDAMNTVAKEEGAARIDEILERLAMAYLGQPSERPQLIKTLPDPNFIISWAGVPPVVQYENLLQSMVEKPALASPALKKAEELGILNRMRLSRWFPSESFKNDPEKVIEQLNHSSMLGDIAKFRCYPRESGLQFHGGYPPSETLLDWVLAEIRKLDEQSQKPFLKFFEAKDSFGSKMILATFEKNSAQSLVKLLNIHLAEIKALPDSRRKEFAIFLNAKLPENATDIRNALASALQDTNSERLQKFKEKFLTNQYIFGLSSDSSLQSLFGLLYQDDPEKAIEALSLTVSLLPERILATSSQKERLLGRSSSVATKLLEGILLHALSNDGAKATEFYLRVLADERLQTSLIIDENMLSPRFPSKGSAQSESDQFKNALKSIIEISPQSFPKDYLFISTIKRFEHFSNRELETMRSPQFREEVLSSLPLNVRDIVESGLILGAHSYDWCYRSHKTPQWVDPKIAAAFEEVGARIRNKNLPMNLRLALATMVCQKCSIHTPATLVNDCALLLTTAWAEDALVSPQQEDDILKIVSYREADKMRSLIAQSLIEAWQERGTRIEQETGEKPSQVGWTLNWLIALATTQDLETFSQFAKKHWEQLDDSSHNLLPLLVRSGNTDLAVQLFEQSKANIIKDSRFSNDVYFDQKLADRIPDFLTKIEDAEEKILAQISFNCCQNDPFAIMLPQREERFLALAKLANEIEFTQPNLRRGVYLILSEEQATFPLISESLLSIAELPRLAEIMKTSERYGWTNRTTTMIHSLITAEKFDQALEVLANVALQSQSDPWRYREVWSRLSQGVSSGVSTHQENSEILAQMLPLTNFMAALPAERQLSDNTRAGNYARNIFCHALLDRMDDWKQWRAGLEPDVQKEADEFWHSHSGRGIGLPVHRTPKHSPLKHRLGLMKRILSQKEVIGTHGFLYEKAIQELHKKQFFSTAEFLEIGAGLVEDIPDGGNAKTALQKIIAE